MRSPLSTLLPAGALALALLFAPAICAQDAAAKPEAISLWEKHAPNGDGTFAGAEQDAEIFVHRPSQPNGCAMVICPGGGYGGLVMGAEGHGIATWLNQHGITGVVLKYRLPKGRAMVPLLDAQQALRYTRVHSQELGLDPHKIGIIGFSAGGHLASTAETHFDAGNPAATNAIERTRCRPDFAILVYPVITMGGQGHSGSRQNLMGPSPSPETITLFSNEKQVTQDTPPTFLAHAQDDKVVPIANSEMFTASLQAKHVPAKLLALPSGGHGLSGYKGPSWDAWQAQSLAWLEELKMIPAGATK